jgi:hypothetical protein
VSLRGATSDEAISFSGKGCFAEFILLAFLLTGCSSLVTEHRMAKLDTEVRAIQHDFHTFSATFTPEQREKYTRAKATQDDPTFQEFYASLTQQQQATMTALLDRAQQAERERQSILATLQQDLTTRWIARQEVARLQGFSVGGVP